MIRRATSVHVEIEPEWHLTFDFAMRLSLLTPHIMQWCGSHVRFIECLCFYAKWNLLFCFLTLLSISNRHNSPVISRTPFDTFQRLCPSLSIVIPL